MTERLLTVDQLTDELQHIGRNTAYNLIASGQIRHVRLGTSRNARILIPESAVAEFLAGQRPSALVASVSSATASRLRGHGAAIAAAQRLQSPGARLYGLGLPVSGSINEQ